MPRDGIAVVRAVEQKDADVTDVGRGDIVGFDQGWRRGGGEEAGWEANMVAAVGERLVGLDECSECGESWWVHV